MYARVGPSLGPALALTAGIKRAHKYMAAMDNASGHHLKGSSIVKSPVGLHYSIHILHTWFVF